MGQTGDGPLGILEAPGQPVHRDMRWSGQPVRVTAPVPTEVWAEVAAADPSTLPFQTPVWRDCLCSGSGWRDASRLYEVRDGRRLVLMMARRAVAPGCVVEASWPAGWGTGGVLAPGGVRPGEAAMICADLRRGRAVSSCLRPGFATASAWPGAASGAFLIPRAVHVAHFGGETFDDYWASRVPVKMQRGMRAARRHHEKAGVVISSGNSPDLVDALYQVYLSWIDWRAGQRRMPAALARWQARRAEPLAKFAAVASALGPDCRIWVAWLEGRPVAATVSLYAGEAAIGWRAFTDRAAPNRLRLFEVLAMEGLRDACETGRRYLEMGESVGRKDLSAIKERLGAQEHAFAEYCFERVPLAAGRMAFQRYRRRAERWITERTGRKDSA
jgi:hypothetical protein